ncbi:MAG TPA: hypothetical protein VJS45_07820 [Acidimicrobiia bacterium]|nr:hypothetical protein [Acidimicrobiia bacterium]
MAPLLTKSRPAPPRSRVGLAVVGVVAVGVALILLIMPVLRLPSFVDAVTVSNPHFWHAEVDVGRPDGSRWIGLGQVGRGETVTFRDVIDPGEQWLFRFAYPGIEDTRVTISRTELEASDWAVMISDEFAERVRAAGESPSA